MGGKKDPEDTPQFNYRHPGEAETMGTESKEDPDRDHLSAEEVVDDDKDEDGEGLSENKGMSDPKTQKEIDDENTSSAAR